MSVSFLNLGKMEKFTSLSLLSIPKVHVVMLWIQVSFMVLHHVLYGCYFKLWLFTHWAVMMISSVLAHNSAQSTYLLNSCCLLLSQTFITISESHLLGLDCISSPNALSASSHRHCLLQIHKVLYNMEKTSHHRGTLSPARYKAMILYYHHLSQKTQLNSFLKPSWCIQSSDCCCV